MNISFKGILIGSFSDIALSNVVSFGLAMYIAFQLGKAGFPTESIMDNVMYAMKSEVQYVAASFALGALCSMLGGYVSVVVAKRNEIINGACASFLCVIFTIYSMIFDSNSFPSGFIHYR